MLCDTCQWGERPGFVRATRKRADDGARYQVLVPCPDCGGTGIAHCCDGICEQPSPDAAGERAV
jgi:hypothetical protein